MEKLTERRIARLHSRSLCLAVRVGAYTFMVRAFAADANRWTRIMEKNYQGTSTFNFETYEELIQKVGNLTKSDDPDTQKHAQTVTRFIDRAMSNLINYVTVVDNGEHQIRTAKYHLEGEALCEAIMNADRTRRNAHEAAIAATTALNRLAAQHCNSVIFTGDATDRLAVADFCLDVTTRLFVERQQ